MKIGIVTFFNVPNYGAMLQAYALWHYMESRGHEVEFVAHPFCTQKPIPLWKCFVSRHLKGVRNKLSGIVHHTITEFAESYPKTRQFERYEELADLKDRYDAVIVGSDQMWNPKWCGKPNCIELLFLGFAGEKTLKASYAASFGTTHWSAESVALRTGELLRLFKGISVREESGVKVVEELSGRKDAVCLLDPTLLKTAEFYRSIAGKVHSENYIFKYMLGWSDPDEADGVVHAARDAKGMLEVVDDKTSVSGRLGLVAKVFGVKGKVSLPQWLGAIEQSRFVVTNSFHGTVFSILFHRPFVALKIKGEMSGMNERAATLLKTVGLEDRFLYADDTAGIKRAVGSEIDWPSVDEKLKARRLDTDAFFASLGL